MALAGGMAAPAIAELPPCCRGKAFAALGAGAGVYVVGRAAMRAATGLVAGAVKGEAVKSQDAA